MLNVVNYKLSVTTKMPDYELSGRVKFDGSNTLNFELYIVPHSLVTSSMSETIQKPLCQSAKINITQRVEI